MLADDLQLLDQVIAAERTRLSTPKGLVISAQGCEARATLGNAPAVTANPEGVASIQDPAIRFFAQQLSPSPLPPLSPVESEIKDRALRFFAEQLQPRPLQSPISDLQSPAINI